MDHIGCGCDSPTTTGSTNCTRICDPVRVAPYDGLPLVTRQCCATEWLALKPALAATGASMKLLEKKLRKEVLIRGLAIPEGTVVWLGPTAEAVEAQKGWPLMCSEVLVLEGFCGELWAATDGNSGAKLTVNEIYYASTAD